MDSLYLLPDSQKRIKNAVIELDTLNATFKEQEAAYKQKKQELQAIIKDYADKRNIGEFGFNSSTYGFIKAKPIIVKKITWYIDKLKEKLGKELFNEIVDRTYTINDYSGLVKYLKSCGVNPLKFKKFVNVEEKVNDKKVDELSDLGELNSEQLSGCYNVQANFSYVKISVLEE